jgi:hypothetical protein
MARHLMQDLVEAAGYEPYSYSGRSMYGAKCLAVDPGKDLGWFISDIIEALKQCSYNDDDDSRAEHTAAVEAFRDMRTDSMGRGIVVYFPGVPFEGDKEEDDSEEVA